MTTTTHDCPVRGCKITGLPHHILMCPAHWSRVPRALQRLVYGAWARAALAGGTARHLQACENAIAAVENRPAVELFIIPTTREANR